MRAIVSPIGQSATFVELFFDLVFVFGITQLVGLLHHDLTWVGAGKTVLVFWMVWWAWTQFTWALNAADTTHPFVEFGTLVATAIAFFMAVSIPSVFEEGNGALWFAGTYVGVRVVGLSLYLWVAWSHPTMRRAVKSFGALSIGGLGTALLGGFLGGSTLLYLWGMTIFLDFVAAISAGDNEAWEIHPEHFAERHGLIVIIALGESLIVAAAALVGAELQGQLLVTAVLAVAISCGLWWTYFPIAKPELEAALERTKGRVRANVARDALTFGHFPMLCGVIAYAVGLEEALAHPTDPLPDSGRLAIALGLMLFVGGTALAMWRATCGTPVRRVLISSAAALALYLAAGVPPIVTLGTALVGVAVIAFLDERQAERLREGGPGQAQPVECV